MTSVEFREVLAADSDQRLDRWLRRHFPLLSQAIIEKLCRKGQIRVDRARVKPSFKLSSGQVVRLPPLQKSRIMNNKVAIKPPLSDIDLIKKCLIYKDPHIFALNKPAGLAVQGGSSQGNRNVDRLVEFLADPGDEKPRLVHRLDKETSGVLLVARDRKTAEKLALDFKLKRIKKIYWALVAGTPPSEVGTVRLSLLKAKLSPRGQRMITVPFEKERVHSGVKRATTDFVIIEKVAKRATWVGLSPVTGRTHQLRVHMSAIGCPIIGDTKYGFKHQINNGSGWGAKIGGIISDKLHLHSRSITFKHPVSGNNIILEADLPTHMVSAWRAFNWQLKWAPTDPFAIHG